MQQISDKIKEYSYRFYKVRSPMNVSITFEEATVRFSDLIDQVSRGEEITIIKEGQVIARLLPPDATPRIPGTATGMITIAPDFDDPLPDDLLAAFES